MFFPRAYHEKIQTPFQSAVARVVPHSIVVPLEKHVVFPRGCWIMGRRGQSNGEVAVMICYRSLFHGCDGCYNHPQMAGLYRFIFYGIEFPTWPLPSFLSSPWRLSPPAGRSQSAAEQIVFLAKPQRSLTKWVSLASKVFVGISSMTKPAEIGIHHTSGHQIFCFHR